MENILLKFVWKFFKNLGATLSIRNDVLTISNVPEKFEKFFGKKSPYKFTTIKELSNDEIEFLEKGSYSLKTISNYLENSGETTLLKINFKCNPELEIKKRLSLPNSTISKMQPKKKNNIFFRFTFHSSFQYLNEHEKIINEIYVHDGKIVKGDLSDYPVVEGKKSEINIPDMKNAYFIAKEELKERLKNKTQKISEQLNEVLKKEIKRIEKHFEHEEKEAKLEFEKAKERLKEIQKSQEKDKINKQKKALDNLKQRIDPNERLNDKERSILIEKTKHGLNINNKLFNTTLIYHQLYSYDITIKKEDKKKTFEVTYDPLTKSLKEIICPVCKEQTSEIYLGNNEHIACKKCMSICPSCNNQYCKNCLNTKCEICGKIICKNCAIRCKSCGRIMCKSHTIKDKLTNRVYCQKCLKKCPRCGLLKIPNEFKISRKTKTEICETCNRKEIKESIVRSLD